MRWCGIYEMVLYQTTTFHKPKQRDLETFKLFISVISTLAVVLLQLSFLSWKLFVFISCFVLLHLQLFQPMLIQGAKVKEGLEIMKYNHIQKYSCVIVMFLVNIQKSQFTNSFLFILFGVSPASWCCDENNAVEQFPIMRSTGIGPCPIMLLKHR